MNVTPRNERNDMKTVTYTPKTLAEEIGVTPKVLRTYLRKHHTRPAEAKNTTWIVPANVASAAKEAFKKNEATDAA